MIILALRMLSGAQAAGTIDRIYGYDGYKFGMTVEEAKKVRSQAKQTNCHYKDGVVVTCLEYPTKIGEFDGQVVVQFEGAPAALTQIVVQFGTVNGPIEYKCQTIGTELLKLLKTTYGDDPFFAKDHSLNWASPKGGSVSFAPLCLDDDGHGLIVVAYQMSNPL